MAPPGGGVPPHSPARRRCGAAAQRPSGPRHHVRPHRGSRRRRCGRRGGRTRADPPDAAGHVARVSRRPDQGRRRPPWRARAASRSAVPSPRIEAARRTASAPGGRRARRSPTARDTPSAPISSSRGMCSAVRAASLPCHRVEHRVDEERIATGGRFEGGAEGVVRLQAVQLAREHGDRRTPERFGTDRRGLRIGDELGDKRGIAALALRRPRPAATRSGTPSSRRVRYRSHRKEGASAQCRSSIASSVGCWKATLAASQ